VVRKGRKIRRRIRRIRIRTVRTATDDVAETLRPSLITDVFALSALFRTSYAFIPANQSYKWSSILSEWFSVVSYCRYCNQTEVRF